MTAGHSGWVDYLIEGALLAGFLVSASAFTILVEHPRGLLSGLVADPLTRHFVVGCAMGTTAAVLIYSRWGARSGAHMNPVVTLALSGLRGMPPQRVAGYVAGQFAGGIAGMAAAALLFGSALSHASVDWVVTRPGPAGVAAAFIGEASMTLLLMSVVLRLSNHPQWAPRTGVVTAVLLAAFITFEAPVSGVSLNPARSLGPALFAGDFTALWIYFTAPTAGMWLAVRAFAWQRRGGACRHGFDGVRT